VHGVVERARVGLPSMEMLSQEASCRALEKVELLDGSAK
jgi:hypothetical protein